MYKQIELIIENKNSKKKIDPGNTPAILRDKELLAKARPHDILRALLGKNINDKVINHALLCLANSNAGYDSFMQLDGIGERGAAILTAIKCVAEGRKKYNTYIEYTSNAIPLFNEYMYKTREHFVAIFLNGMRRVLDKKVISIGSVNKTIVHPREVFSHALSLYTTEIILGHNHPSGDVQPSPEDIVTTKRMAAVGKIIGIEILDHIIFGPKGTYYSFAEHDQL